MKMARVQRFRLDGGLFIRQSLEPTSHFFYVKIDSGDDFRKMSSYSALWMQFLRQSTELLEVFHTFST